MSDIEEVIVTELPRPWETIQDGDYAIVELFGHTTLVGRIEEVERFGTKMLAIQPIFAGKLLGPIYNGGAAIYRLTPCSRRARSLAIIGRVFVPTQAPGSRPSSDW